MKKTSSAFHSVKNNFKKGKIAMKKREILEMIVNGEINEDIIAWAEKEIEKLDAANARNRERAEKKRAEDTPFIENLKELLEEEPQPASYFAEATGLSTSKVCALFRRFDEGEVAVTKIKGKSGKVNGYAAP